MQTLSSSQYTLHNVCLIAVLLTCRRGYTAKLPAELLPYLQTSQSVFCFAVLFRAPVAEYIQSKMLLTITNIHMSLPALQRVSNAREMLHRIKLRIY